MKFFLFQRSLTQYLPFYCLPQGVLTIFFVPNMILQPVNAQDLNKSLPLKRSAQTSQYPVYQGLKQEYTIGQVTTQTQVIKFKLNDLSGVSEWIRVEVTGNQVKLLHTVVSKSGFSKAISGITMLPIALNHTWYDHITSRSFFRPKGCENSDCLISGTDVITLPDGTNIYEGEFVLEYKESGWVRTVTFKLAEQNKSGINTTQTQIQTQSQSQISHETQPIKLSSAH